MWTTIIAALLAIFRQTRTVLDEFLEIPVFGAAFALIGLFALVSAMFAVPWWIRAGLFAISPLIGVFANWISGDPGPTGLFALLGTLHWLFTVGCLVVFRAAGHKIVREREEVKEIN